MTAPRETLEHLRVTALMPHPHNPRHDATADEDMVASVKASGLIEPLVAAPVENGVTEAGHATHVLIAGHRRLDAAKRAGLDRVPVIVRADLDTEPAQIAAMVIENGQRKDLTVMEEAEGYQLMLDLGWKPAAIAKAVGRPTATVSGRLKLLKLDERTKTKVHDGQVTLTEAVAVAELPAVEADRVAKHLGKSDFSWELAQAQRRITKRRDVEKQIKGLKQDGARQVKLPDSKSLWEISDAEDGMTRLGATFSSDPADHPAGKDGCLGFVVVDDSYDGRRVEYVCLDVARHDEQLTAAQKDARAAREAAEEARRRREEDADLARRLRLAAVTGLFTIAPRTAKASADLLATLDRLLADLLPLLVAAMTEQVQEAYMDALGLDRDQRWDTWAYRRDQGSADTFEQHAATIATGPVTNRARALAALLAAHHEYQLPRLEALVRNHRGPNGMGWHTTTATSLDAYYTLLLDVCGYEIVSDIDREYLQLLHPDPTTDTTGEEVD